MQSVASITTERAIFSFHFFSLIWNENWRKTNVSEWKSCPQPTAHISIHFYFQNGPAANKKCRFLQYCNIANRSWQFFGFNFHESISRRLFAAFDHFFFVFKEWRIIYMPNKVKFQRFNRQATKNRAPNNCTGYSSPSQWNRFPKWIQFRLNIQKRFNCRCFVELKP